MGSEKRFSNFLMASIVGLVTSSVLLISIVLYYYFNNRLTSEFNNKLLAQKGQTELILKNRITHVKSKLKELSQDNTIRVTMMLEVAAQLEERLKKSYPSQNGMYFFVKGLNSGALFPKDCPELSDELLKFALRNLLKDEIIQNGSDKGLFWAFSTPIMRRTEQLGTAFVIYDMTKDQEVFNVIQKTVDSDIAIIKGNNFVSLISGSPLPLRFTEASKTLYDDPIQSTFTPLKGSQHILSQLNNFKNLYFISPLAKFTREKQKVSLFIGLFSLLVMILSAIVAVFLGKQMSRPLKEIAAKAIQISEEKKESLFDITSDYREISLLSRSFNNMLTSIAEEKSRYENLLDNVDDAVYIFDSTGNIIEANEATYSQLGYSAEDFFNKNITDILHDNDSPIFLARLSTNNKKPTPQKITLETWHKKANGQIIPVEINSKTIIYEGKKVILNVARDLSSRKKAEKALRESEGKYRSILENIEECYFEIDLSGTLLFFNKAMCDIWGYTNDELKNVSHWKLSTHESAEELSEIFNAISKTGTPSRIDHYKIISKKGDTKIIELSVSPLKDIAGRLFGFRGVGRDVTEHLRMEEEKELLELQLQKGRRMEAIGTLAGGIAHDFNNLLAAVLGFTDLAMLTTPKENKNYENLEGIRKAGLRGKDLVSQILAFSRQAEPKKRPIEVTPIIKENLKMIKASAPPNAKIRSNIASDTGKVLADPTQIHQIIMNLCTNAIHAMKAKGGVLEVNLSKMKINSNDLIDHPNLKEGEFIKLSVSDTGLGMTKEVMERIFEPFFTTKKTGEGSGMGMAVVHGIVSNHNGAIAVHSEIGKGSTFDIYLPIIVTEQDEEEPSFADNQLKKGKKEHILFVDDAEDLVKIGEQMLKHLGYKVDARTSSIEALKAFQDHPGKFDLVITDQAMPNMTGVELAQKILHLRPDIPIILCTGFSESISEKNAKKLGIRKFLMKPLALKNFSETIRDALEKTDH